jgi:hypothetical protein
LLFILARLCIGGVPERDVSLPSHWPPPIAELDDD